MKRIAILVTVLIIIACKQTFASHAAGGELLYRYLPTISTIGVDEKYELTFKFYRDCTGINAPTSVTMCYFNSSLPVANYLTTTLVALPLINGGSPNGGIVSTGCGTTNTTCAGGNIFGFQEWWYQDTVSLTTAGVWRFWVAISARNPTFTHPQQSDNLYIEAKLDNQSAPGNSGPFFTFKPVPYLCATQTYNYNNGAIDPDGDSLSYASVTPQNGNTGCTSGPGNGPIVLNPAFPAYNANTNPMPNTAFNVNPTTGLVTINPSQVDAYVLTIEIKEWRNGINVGTVFRDIQVAVVTCNIQYPTSLLNTTTAYNLTLDPTTSYYTGCVGDSMHFCIDINGLPDTSFLNVATNAQFVFPNATVIVSGIGTDTASVCIGFKPTFADIGLNNITVIFNDTNCLYSVISSPISFTVPIFISPFTVANKDTIICVGDTAKLSVQGGSQFTWSVISGTPNSLTCTTCPNPMAFPGVKTVYQVVSNLTNICGDNKDTVVVDVFPILPLTVGPDTNLCINSAYAVNGILSGNNTGYTFTWSPTTFLSSSTIINPIILNPTSNITYTLTAKPAGQSSCSSKDTLKIKVLQPLDIFNGDTTICNAQSVQIAASGDPLYQYSWTPTTNVVTASTKNALITPSVSTEYTLTATYPSCPDSSHIIKINVEPVPTINAGPDQLICVGNSLQLNAQNAPNMPGGFYTYSWTPSAQILNDNSILDPVFTGSTTNTLVVSATSPVAKCTASDNIVITVVQSNFLNPLPEPSLCPNLSFNYSASGALYYDWKPSNGLSDSTIANPIASPIATTVYTLYGTDINGCRDTVYSTFYRANAGLVELGPDTTLYPGDILQLYAQGNGAVFNWSPSLGLNATNIQNPLAQPTVSMQYIVNVTNDFGCKDADSIIINVSNSSNMNIPKAFSPGLGTSENDYFKLDRRGIATINYFRIYDRWGTLIFETTDVNAGWNGTFKDKPQPLGTYVYMIDAVDPSGKRFTRTGNVTLIR